jgi:hypothetical protein
LDIVRNLLVSQQCEVWEVAAAGLEPATTRL